MILFVASENGFPLYGIELHTRVGILVGIGWYFVGIIPTNTNRKLGWYILVLQIWREHIILKKGGWVSAKLPK